MIRTVGERAFLLECRSPLVVAAAARAACAARAIELAEVVPAAATVLVQAADVGRAADLREALAGIDEAGSEQPMPAHPLPQPPEAARIEIAVHFDGPDLAAVAEATGLTTAEVISTLVETPFTAAFTGFAPGFAYLTSLPPRLRLPRRVTPRTRVPAGSLAIAEEYAAVYPRASPGGWRLLGRTDQVLFDPRRDPPALISPGTVVRFRQA